MATCNCANRQNCLTGAVILSVLVGIVAAILRIAGVITVTPVFLWVVFGIAVGYLAVLLATMGIQHACGGTARTALLAGIVGTVLLALLLLAVPFAATSVFGAILTGLLLFSFVLVITATACLVWRPAGCNR